MKASKAQSHGSFICHVLVVTTFKFTLLLKKLVGNFRNLVGNNALALPGSDPPVRLCVHPRPSIYFILPSVVGWGRCSSGLKHHFRMYGMSLISGSTLEVAQTSLGT